MRAHNFYWFARLHRLIADGALAGERQWTADSRDKLARTLDGYRDGFERYPVAAHLS